MGSICDMTRQLSKLWPLCKVIFIEYQFSYNIVLVSHLLEYIKIFMDCIKLDNRSTFREKPDINQLNPRTLCRRTQIKTPEPLKYCKDVWKWCCWAEGEWVHYHLISVIFWLMCVLFKFNYVRVATLVLNNIIYPIQQKRK